MTDLPDPTRAKRIRGLRANSLAATIILLVEYGLGMWVNLYGHLPATDHGANLATGFARAVADGPAGLAVHALVGVILIASATSAVVRSVGVRRSSLIAATVVGLVAIVTAALSGAGFVGTSDQTASMAMAVAGGIAIGAYALVLFIAGGAQPPRPAPPAIAEPDARRPSLDRSVSHESLGSRPR